MGQIYSFQDPLPLVFDNGLDLDESAILEDETIELAEDGWPSPGRCIICGAPYTSCTGDSELG